MDTAGERAKALTTGAESRPFVLGVNYWPRRKAMYWWSEFDRGEVQEEFAVIRELGLDLVRIFLLWEDWQPDPERVSRKAMGHLEAVCDAAADLDLQLDVTFFVGHMSGPSWVPSWMLRSGPHPSPAVRQVVTAGQAVRSGYANPFTDPVALRAAELLVQTVAGYFGDHPAIGLWNLGNEPDLFAWPPSAADSRAWVRRMTALIREAGAPQPVTCGLHVNSLVEDNGLRVHEVFDEVDLAVMHGYPMYATWAAGPLDVEFVPFLCSLTAALCGKPALMEEFGGPTGGRGEPSTTWKWTSYGAPRSQFVPSEEELAGYIEAVLPRLVDVGTLGAMLWCFADYAPELYNRPPCDEAWHERFFGLVRPDGSLKPHTAVVQRFSATAPEVQAARRTVELDVSSEEYYQDPLGHAKRLYRAYRV